MYPYFRKSTHTEAHLSNTEKCEYGGRGDTGSVPSSSPPTGVPGLPLVGAELQYDTELEEEVVLCDRWRPLQAEGAVRSHASRAELHLQAAGDGVSGQQRSPRPTTNGAAAQVRAGRRANLAKGQTVRDNLSTP